MRVLVVEDEASIANFVRRGLYEAGYAVDVACDGEEGLDYALAAEYDVLILDIMLIGVGIGSVILIILISGMFGGTLQGVIPYLTALQLMALCVGIALLAAVLNAWGASGEKPLNVLRYE